ncbi:MAG: PilW family protein [Limisphaerales bacterium]
MDFRTTSTKPRQSGLTLVETLVAVGLSSFIGLAIAFLSFYSGRSFAAMANYVDLEKQSQYALNIMSREIRQADALSSCVTNGGYITSLTFSYDGTPLTYGFDPTARTLTRAYGGSTQILLKECDFLSFLLFQRNPIGGSYDQYPAATPATCKMVQLTWVCSRTILGAKVNTESVQSAKIVIRKE